MHFYYFTLVVFSALGAGLTFIASRKSPLSKRDKWIKYLTYTGFVFSLFAWLELSENTRLAIFLSIALLATVEFIRAIALVDKLRKYAGTVVIYLVCISGFIGSSMLSPEILAPVLLAVILFDSFSQLFGQIFGNRRILPRISPNKTVEGFIGGWTVVLVTALLEHRQGVGLSSSLMLELLYASGLAILAFTGDTLASVVKRRLGIKDYSNWIPSHGGVNDRMDSLVFTLFAISIATLINY